MHQRYILWYAGGSILFKRANKRYSWSTSRTLAVIILICSKWNFSMCKRSVDIWDHLYHVLTGNSLIKAILNWWSFFPSALLIVQRHLMVNLLTVHYHFTDMGLAYPIGVGLNGKCTNRVMETDIGAGVRADVTRHINAIRILVKPDAYRIG